MISISVRFLLLSPIWGIALVVLCFFGASFGPDIEEGLFPVITDQSVSDPTRTSDRACWHWTYTKQRNVFLVRKAFYIERDDGIKFPVAEFRPDLGIPSNDSTTAKAGMTRTIPECVAIPYMLRSAARFTLHGDNFYMSWHRLWELRQPVTSVEIDFPASGADERHDRSPATP